MGFLQRVLGGAPVEPPHDDPELESQLPAAVAGRHLERWSVRGERAFSPDGRGLSSRDRAAIEDDLAGAGLSLDDVSKAVAGRAATSDPPFLIQAWRFGDRPANELPIELAIDTKGLGGWAMGFLGGHTVTRGTADMFQQTRHLRGRPYVVLVGPVHITIATDEEGWAEEVCRLLPSPQEKATGAQAAVEKALQGIGRGKGDFAIFEVPGGRNIYAQVHIGDSLADPLYGEIVGNEHLDPADRLDTAGQARLIAAGWTADRSGVGNYTRDWPAWTEDSDRASSARDILDGLGVFGSAPQSLWILVDSD